MLKLLILVTVLAVGFLDQATSLTPFGLPMTHNGFQGLKPLFGNNQFGFFGSKSAFQVEKPTIEAEAEPLIKTMEENENHPEIPPIPLRRLFRFRPLRKVFIGKRGSKQVKN